VVKLIFVVVLLAALIYLLMRTIDTRGAALRDRIAAKRDVRRSVAPDDDDSFLRSLDRHRRDDDTP
jgi:flagellar biogenesis protein FliO